MIAMRRWLLLLGSNLAHDTRVRDALERLSSLGQATPLTSIQHFPSHDGNRGEYYNALAVLAVDVPRGVLTDRLRQLEVALGRRRDADGEVAIDVDILAMSDGERWLADTHALAKGEFERLPVATLLRQAAITAERDSSG